MTTTNTRCQQCAAKDERIEALELGLRVLIAVADESSLIDAEREASR